MIYRKSPHSQNVLLIIYYASFLMNVFHCFWNWHNLREEPDPSHRQPSETVSRFSVSCRTLHTLSIAPEIKCVLTLPFESVYGLKKAMNCQVREFTFKSGLVLTMYLWADHQLWEHCSSLKGRWLEAMAIKTLLSTTFQPSSHPFRSGQTYLKLYPSLLAWSLYYILSNHSPNYLSLTHPLSTHPLSLFSVSPTPSL